MTYDLPIPKELHDFLNPVPDLKPVTISINDLRVLATKVEENNE